MWFKFNNLGLARGMALKSYTSVAKGLKLKVKMSWGLSHTFVEVTGKNLIEEPFWPPILNSVNEFFDVQSFKK